MIMQNKIKLSCIAFVAWCGILLLPGTTLAWGPRAETAIVTNAVHLLSKESNIPLRRLEQEVRAGVLLSPTEMEQLYPGYRTNLLVAIENEMYLLQSVRGDRVDAYLAFRLGALGKMITQSTAPMQDSGTNQREQYYSDVDQQIQRVELKLSPRTTVDPRTYLPLQMTAANVNNSVYQREYQDGIGFNGLAGAMISEDTSRSLAAVANIWFTILTSPVVPGSVSPNELQQYVINAYRFYIPRGNINEINAVEQRLEDLTTLSAGMRVQIGDMFYEAGMEERAIAVFQRVVQEDPDRRDVMERIADFYVDRGKGAMEDGRYQAAMEDFALALNTFPLHNTAEGFRLNAERELNAREARLTADQIALEHAAEFEQLAEQEAQRQRFAEAIVLLGQARSNYNEVSDEFPSESRLRSRGLDSIRSKTEALKRELINNAQAFSGSGFQLDAQQMAQENLESIDQHALQQILRNNFEAELRALGRSLQDVSYRE